MRPELISDAASCTAAILYTGKHFPPVCDASDTRTYGSDDHSRSGDVCLKAAAPDTSSVAVVSARADVRMVIGRWNDS